MNLAGHDIAVCSWSLHPRNLADLSDKVRALGLKHVQLALADLLALDASQQAKELEQLRAGGIGLTGAMMSFAGEDYSSIEQIRKTGGFLVPDAEWRERKRLSIEGAKLAKRLGIKTITSHVGFVPPPADPGFAAAVARIDELAKHLADHGIELLMETGQEPASELLHFLQSLRATNVHINFDPANMILYGAGDPIKAIGVLGPHIRHVHVKDGTASSRPGVDWGAEVPFGTGQVNAARFLEGLKKANYSGPLAIEREAGNDRMPDVAFAIRTLQGILH